MNVRYCKVCGKKLAQLNPHPDLCFAHNPAYPKYRASPVTCCGGGMPIKKDGQPIDTELLNMLGFSWTLVYPDLGGQSENDDD